MALTPGDNLRQEIARRAEAFVREHGYAFSEHKEAVLDDLVRMHQKYGDFYCPCQPDNNADTVCICAAVRRGLVETEGACYCHFILKGS